MALIESSEAAPKAVASFGTPLMDRINLYFRLRRYIKMLARRWYLVVLTTGLGAGVAAHKAINTPNLYRAVSKIGIASKVVTPYDNKAYVVADLSSFYESHLEYMRSSKVIQRVQDKMNADRRFAGKTPFVNPMAANGPGYFLMTVESTDFDYARQYAIHWAREFMAFKEESTAGAIEQSLAENRREIERVEKKLERARQALQEFQIRHNIASVKETADAAQQRLDNLLDEYTAIQTLRQRLENKSSRELAKGGILEATRKTTEPPQGSNATGRRESSDPLERFIEESRFSELEFKLKTREADYQKYSATLKPKHPFMVALQSEIDRLKNEIQYQLELIEGKRLARIASLKSDEESYLPLIEKLRKQVFESRGIQNEFERLKADESDIKADLENLRKAARALEASNSRENLLTILEEGIGSPAPVSPNRRKIILAGFLFGLVSGLGLIYLLDRLDDRLELAEDIEAELETPVLGQIPLMNSKEIPRGGLVITKMAEHCMFAESIRVVRSAVMLGIEGGKKQVMVITSAIPGDGKTVFTVNFAVTLAIAGHRVLLVDADMRRGNTHTFFDCQREPGLSEVLSGKLNWTDAARQTPVPTLKVITTGALPGNPGELLISHVTQQLIREARQQFDYIVFDCPPLTAIDDTFALVGLADGILFVVRAGQTSMRFARNAIAAVHQRGARIFGVVLNGITADNPYYYYNHYYHGYYNRNNDSKRLATTTPPGTTMAAPRQHPSLASAPTPTDTSSNEG